jgi:hypothetical protein
MLTGVFIVELLPGSKAIVDEVEAEEGTPDQVTGGAGAGEGG